MCHRVSPPCHVRPPVTAHLPARAAPLRSSTAHRRNTTDHAYLSRLPNVCPCRVTRALPRCPRPAMVLGLYASHLSHACRVLSTLSPQNCCPLYSFPVVTATTLITINCLKLSNGRPLAIIAISAVSFFIQLRSLRFPSNSHTIMAINGRSHLLSMMCRYGATPSSACAQ